MDFNIHFICSLNYEMGFMPVGIDELKCIRNSDDRELMIYVITAVNLFNRLTIAQLTQANEDIDLTQCINGLAHGNVLLYWHLSKLYGLVIKHL